MFRLTQKQRRRLTLPLVVVFVLHWCFGIGAVAASVVCLEPGGRTAIELVSKQCADSERGSTNAKHCIDMPADDGHLDHELRANADAKAPVAALQSVAFFYLLPLLTAAPLVSLQALAPPATNHPAVLRESTVLRI